MQRLGETGFGLLGLAVFALGPLAQAAGWLPAVVAGSALVGVGLPWTVVAGFTAVQRFTPPERMGRVAGSAGTAIFAPPALGIPLGALLVSIVDYRAPLVAMSVIGLGTCIGVATRAVGAARPEAS
jgi:MFS family permease